MRDAQQRGPVAGQGDHRAWSEIVETLAEAGLGQGHGIEWLIDRLTTEPDRRR